MLHYLSSTSTVWLLAVMSLVFYRLHSNLQKSRQANAQLLKALEEIQHSARELRALQEGLQVVCAWTQRIKVDDQWLTPSQFLSERLRLKLTHGISPEGMRLIEESLHSLQS